MVDASSVTRLRMACKGAGVVAVLGGVLALAPPAGAVIPPSLEDEGGEVTAAAVLPTDRSVTATPETPAAWRGSQATGHNINFDAADPAASCGKTDANYCDITLVNVVPGSFYDTAAGGVDSRRAGPRPAPTSISTSMRATRLATSAPSPVPPAARPTWSASA